MSHRVSRTDVARMFHDRLLPVCRQLGATRTESWALHNGNGSYGIQYTLLRVPTDDPLPVTQLGKTASEAYRTLAAAVAALEWAARMPMSGSTTLDAFAQGQLRAEAIAGTALDKDEREGTCSFDLETGTVTFPDMTR